MSEFTPSPDTGPAPGWKTQVWQQVQQRRLSRWSLRVLLVLVFLSIFGDFLANDKPLYCRIAGKSYWPIVQDFAARQGWYQWPADLARPDWRDLPYEKVVRTPIPYGPRQIDRRNLGLRSPGGRQRLDTPWERHWLGTDRLGRDVAAGLISGARTALLIGLVAMAVAALVGLFLGALAGYFGDQRFQLSRAMVIALLISIPTSLFYGTTLWHVFPAGAKSWSILAGIMIMLTGIGAGRFFQRRGVGRRSLVIPLDQLIQRLIELLEAIPALLLILAVVSLVRRPSIFLVMVIIGLIRWTSIARFVRAELLRLRQATFLEAARGLGFSHARIIWRHALPNALPPVLVTLAFGVAGAVLVEAYLSFLGIGLPPDSVTWGSMLQQVRESPKAWWLATFPGLAIFITVTVFNLLGDTLTEALNPKTRVSNL
ncbi:MAG: ABC transporter permease [Lewinellaceae bacterium]|nr:ABC transporter permease [Lewinellaceae bacterium]